MKTTIADGHPELVETIAAPPALVAQGEIEWLLWQLADSAFPTGGFAHSAGLEAALQQKEVRNGEQLAAYVEAHLTQLRRFTLPFVAAAHADPTALPDLDKHFDHHNTNHVANRSSRAQGLALLASTRRIFRPSPQPPAPSPQQPAPTNQQPETSNQKPETSHQQPETSNQKPATSNQQPATRNQPPETSNPPCGHLPPVFGAVCRRLGLEREQTLALFTYQHLRNLIASAVRLNIVGPLEGQSLQHRLSRTARQRLQEGIPAVEGVAQTNPLLDLWQGAHDRLYSRLFQS